MESLAPSQVYVFFVVRTDFRRFYSCGSGGNALKSGLNTVAASRVSALSDLVSSSGLLHVMLSLGKSLLRFTSCDEASTVVLITVLFSASLHDLLWVTVLFRIVSLLSRVSFRFESFFDSRIVIGLSGVRRFCQVGSLSSTYRLL